MTIYHGVRTIANLYNDYARYIIVALFYYIFLLLGKYFFDSQLFELKYVLLLIIVELYYFMIK